MEVSEFVTQTLSQIFDGLTKANQRYEDDDQSPRFGTTGHARILDAASSVFQDVHGHIYTSVEFDMAVTVTAEAGAGAKLKIPYFEAGADGSKSSESISRVKFSIPCKLS